MNIRWPSVPRGFSSRVRYATLGMLVLLLILSALFYGITERYQFLQTRSELASDVVMHYLEVSDHTYRKLNAMGEMVSQGEVTDEAARASNALSLRESVGRVRRSIATEVAFMQTLEESLELDHLVEVERLVESIVTGSVRIRADVQNGRLDDARATLSRIRSDSVAGRFNELVDIALAEEREEMREADEAAAVLGRFISWVLPLFTLLALCFGIGVTVVISRSVTRSVETLRDVALAYASGDFSYRTDKLYEAEFAELGDAFDRLGEQLGNRRETDRRSKAELEQLVAERTQGLRETNEQLAKSDRSRRQLLADISHELRTPLTVIHGEAEMALRGGRKGAEEYEDSLDRIREQALHTNRLVDDLLFVARAEEGHARIQKRSVAIAGMLKAVCADFAVEAEKRRIRISEGIDDDYVVVHGDHDRLRQVFTILMDNALRYTDADGHVQVKLKQQDDGVQIIVKDDGIGLSPEDAEQVFFRFYRGANAQRAAAGTGLGLPVAKAIVEAHQGRISISGAIGEGAEARVWLPAEDSIRAIA
ncbi:MAG: HAMP domain-containing sensor histidine kinase [Pseudomonadota bacterium]